jgi:hypothetical protein
MACTGGIEATAPGASGRGCRTRTAHIEIGPDRDVTPFTDDEADQVPPRLATGHGRPTRSPGGGSTKAEGSSRLAVLSTVCV